MRRAYLLLLLGVLFLPFVSCSTMPDVWSEAKPGQKKVLVTFPPLYAITYAVAGDDAYVLSMLNGKGPHDYEGSPSDVFMVNKADLLIYNGLGLDDGFVNRMLKNHRNKSLAELNVGEALDKESDERVEKKQPALLIEGGGEVHVGPDGKEHKHGEHDPHVWLGPDQAIVMTKIIAAKLGEIDAKHAKDYEKRADKFIEELKKVKADGIAALKDKKNKNIITMHEAFRYFAQAYGVEIVDTIQIKPGVDPDAKKTADLIDLCKKKDVKVIAIEPQYSRKPAEALQHSLKQKGIDVTIVELDPLETRDVIEGKRNPDPAYYLKTMRANIDTLVKALP